LLAENKQGSLRQINIQSYLKVTVQNAPCNKKTGTLARPEKYLKPQ